jgi:hypothetical protein
MSLEPGGGGSAGALETTTTASNDSQKYLCHGDFVTLFVEGSASAGYVSVRVPGCVLISTLVS